MTSRSIGFLIIGIAALIVGVATLVLRPTAFVGETQQEFIAAALADNQANDANAENVNQQMVVNGWVARDLLAINARQNVALIDSMSSSVESQQRTNGLLQGILVLLVLLVGAVAGVGIRVAQLVTGSANKAENGAATSATDAISPGSA